MVGAPCSHPLGTKRTSGSGCDARRLSTGQSIRAWGVWGSEGAKTLDRVWLRGSFLLGVGELGRPLLPQLAQSVVQFGAKNQKIGRK
jgi:hypothetical protein